MSLTARLAPLVAVLVLLCAAPTVAAQQEKSIDDYFNGCKDDWLRTQGPLGSYTLVVCDQGVLDRFFDSGLERYGPEQIRILDPREPPPDPYGFEEKDALSIPDSIETKDKAEWSRAVITNRAKARPYVYAAAQLVDGSVIEARFGPVRMKPNSRWTVRRGRYVWRLVDRRGRTVAKARRRHIDIPRLTKPLDVAASLRNGRLIIRWFSGKQRIGTRFRVYGAVRKGTPWRLLTTLDADGGGNVVSRPFRRKTWVGLVRVEAHRAGKSKSSPAIPVKRRG